MYFAVAEEEKVAAEKAAAEKAAAEKAAADKAAAEKAAAEKAAAEKAAAEKAAAEKAAAAEAEAEKATTVGTTEEKTDSEKGAVEKPTEEKTENEEKDVNKSSAEEKDVNRSSAMSVTSDVANGKVEKVCEVKQVDVVTDGDNEKPSKRESAAGAVVADNNGTAAVGAVQSEKASEAGTPREESVTSAVLPEMVHPYDNMYYSAGYACESSGLTAVS